ncbi:MAG: NUDIX domain-containing protein, partial [Pseudomonas sp.]
VKHGRDARFLWLAEGNAKQARKRVSAKVIMRDQTGRILLVNPTYKEYWDLPGGMVEANEPPRAAAEREIVEELGFQAKIGHLLEIDWIGPHGPWDDQLIFTFDGGTLANATIKELKVADNEISEFGFFSASNASRLLRKDVAQRLMRTVKSLETGRVCYLEYAQQNEKEITS